MDDSNAVTTEELRAILADYLAPIRSDVAEIKVETKKTNGRVTKIEMDWIRLHARETERDKAAAGRERSRRWYAAVITLIITAVSVATPLTSALIHSLH